MKILRNIILSLLLLITASAQAQVGQHRQDFSIGGSAGYTLNQVSFSPTIRQQLKGAPAFGFTTRYVCEKYFNSICAVQLEANYQNLGWKEDIENSEEEFQRDIYCLEVPVLMQMGWGRERKGFKFLFEAGPYLQYFFSSKDKANFDLENPGSRPQDLVYQYTHPIDHKVGYGIQAGLGVEFSSAVGHFILDGRYCYGLGDMYDNSKKGKFGRSANMTIEVKLTYLFDLIRTKDDNIK